MKASFWQSQETINAFREALRCGITCAWNDYAGLKAVHVDSVERTLYPIIRKYAIDYLRAKGYDYLTRHESFFIIGDVSIAGTNKKADGFIADPYSNLPVYAIEIKKGTSQHFRQDLQKSIDVWGMHNLVGVFVILFEESAENSVGYLDGADIPIPLSPYGTKLLPLVLPVTDDQAHLSSSVTSLEYLQRHGEERVFPILNFGRTDSVGFAAAEFVKSLGKIPLVFSLDTLKFDEDRLDAMLERMNLFTPRLVYAAPVVTMDPVKANIPDRLYEYIDKLFESGIPFVFFSDWMKREVYNREDCLWGMLPFTLEAKERMTGEIDVPKDLVSLPDELDGLAVSLKGAMRMLPKGGASVLSKFNDASGGYPFIIERRLGTRISIAFNGGVGGWGTKWHRNADMCRLAHEFVFARYDIS